MRSSRSLLMIVLMLLVVGCGTRPKLVPVTGKVVHKEKGVTAGSIYFHPTGSNEYRGEKPSCLLATDGSFTMRTYPHGNGVPPGEYKVTLAPDLAGRLGRPAYSDPLKTPWTVTVPDSGLKEHVFEVR